MVYNPSDVGVKGTLFGLPYSVEESDLVMIPVPWDVTASYGSGTSNGPEAILDASPQLDLSIHHISDPWKYKSSLYPVPLDLKEKSKKLRTQASQIINQLEGGHPVPDDHYEPINAGCQEMIDYVHDLSDKFLDQQKIVGVLGGDHSSPLGLIQALAQRHEFGILQIDAHMDARHAYEGFTYSHASIMYNALKEPAVSNLVQVGIRDYCEEEQQFVETQGDRVSVYYDDVVKDGLMVGEDWSDWVQGILAHLPKKVYVSFDIDGLEPGMCPNTGTPVPGGLSFDQVNFLLKRLVASGRRIIGFDLCEVSPGSNNWDANVGARMLYRLISYTGLSQGKLKGLI